MSGTETPAELFNGTSLDVLFEKAWVLPERREGELTT